MNSYSDRSADWTTSVQPKYLKEYVIDSLPVLIWQSDVNGLYTYFNSSWIEFTGRPLEHEIGLGWMKSIHPEDYQRCFEFLQKHFKEKKSFEIEYRLQDSERKYRWMMGQGCPQYDSSGYYLGFIGYNIDVSDYKKHLDDLQMAKQAADAANIIKTEFLANVSHEIRSPMSIILGFAEIMRDENMSELERQDLLTRILRNGHQLLNIINDVLDVSKVEANKIEAESIQFSLYYLLQEIHELFDIKSQEKNLIFKINLSDSIPDLVKSDPTRIQQILTNLISNSIKFTNKGEVTLTVTSSPIENNKTYISFDVHDTGIGIAPEYQNKIFKPFGQVDATISRKYGGTGLGLFLSYRLAQVLGGQLALVKSQPNEGSTFQFRIPVEVAEASPPVQLTLTHHLSKKSPLYGIKILIVDDAEENRLLFNRFFSQTGAHVESASNGEIAIQMCQQNKYDIILTDIKMPGMDGYTVLKKIRQFDSKTPIVALTAHALTTEKDKCLQEGFSEHITKPVNRQSLISQVTKILQKKTSK